MRCPLDIENRKVCGEALYFGAVGSGKLEKEKMSMREEGVGGGFSLFLLIAFAKGLDKIG